MIQSILELDKHLFLDLNSVHSELWDSIMLAITGTKIWIPLYAAVVFFIFKKYKWKHGSLILLGFISLVLLTDQSSVHLFKNVFMRLRPCFAPEIKNMVHCPDFPGGKYGFVSSHAANTFGFALLSALTFRNKTFGILIFFWATLVSYSRIYLGVHYPGDILGGALLGMFWAILIFYALKLIFRKLPTLNREKQA